jgi:hypothetical protein
VLAAVSDEPGVLEAISPQATAETSKANKTDVNKNFFICELLLNVFAKSLYIY